MIRTDLIAPIADLLDKQAQAYPEKIAFEDRHRSVTYAALASEVNNLAGHYLEQGLTAGGSVGVWLPNSVDWVVSVLAAIRAGGVAVPIAFDAKNSEMAYRVEDAGITVMVTAPVMADAVSSLHAGIRPDRVILNGVEETEGDRTADLAYFCATPAVSAVPVDDIDSVSMIVYTSGTTGQPKGVMLSTRSMLWVNAACWASIFELGPEDRILSPLPLFHSYALNFCVLSILANGASEFIMERFSTEEAMDLLEQGQFTKVPAVPTMFHYLMLAAKEQGRNPFHSVKRCVSAGAIMAASLNEAFETEFGVELLDGYGITETSTMVTMNWPGSKRVPGSCGLPLPGLSVRLVDMDDCDVPFGEEGELIVRGPNVMKGYHDKPDVTQDALKGGWYRTGDLARMDASGFLTITGRLKELIIRGGQNIAPAEVEETVQKMDGIRDCAVVGVPHDTLGEVPVAFIVPEGDVPLLDDVREFCARTLSSYKLPADVLSVAEIPRTGSGKIMRFRLCDAYVQNKEKAEA